MTDLLPERLLPGRASPLGAHVVENGIQFAVFSQRAKQIELCVFDASGTHELKRYPLPHGEDSVFCGVLPGAQPGLIYGYRVHGSWKPDSGYRFYPHKLLLDPYAREIVGNFEWRPEHFAHAHGHPEGARVLDTRDNAAFALKARVTPPIATRTAQRPRR